MTDILEVKSLSKSFGKLTAVNDLSFSLAQGEILGMMGPNGAGKTTVFNLLTGTFLPDNGQVTFKGEDITKLSPSKRCRKGIGRTYQIPQPFNKLTVYENLLVGAVHGGGFKEKEARERIDEILNIVGLYAKKNQLAGGLPLLNRKALELGRAMATDPQMILLDEVAGGLTEAETENILQIVQEINKRGVSIIWIEHILMTMSRGVDRLLVITQGSYLTSGLPEEVMNSNDVMVSYLGEED
jgi:branched-chain amino acid transport system ATP-binding protein